MDYLLDTHTLLWSLFNSDKLPEKVRNAISHPKNRIFFCNISLWEIQIKHHKHKELMPYDALTIANLLTDADYVSLDVRDEYIFELKNILNESIHKDPFDLMLLAMAKDEQMVLITHDEKMTQYEDVNVLYY